MKTKRLLITIAAALCLMTQTALAQGTGKAIQYGASCISAWSDTNSYDYIYYGNWNSDDSQTPSGPIKWRVLDDQTNTGETGLFLLSDALLGNGTDGDVYFNSIDYANDEYGIEWQGSNAQAWCKNFYSNNLTIQEQGGVLSTTKSDEKYTPTSDPYNRTARASENILSDDKIFFLSAEEAENNAYGFTSNDDRVAYYGSKEGTWWLRSPESHPVNPFVFVVDIRNVGLSKPDLTWLARPAFNFNLNSVLFTSSAESGKSADGMDSGLTAVSDYDGSEWKLTLLDTNRSFSITETAAKSEAGGTITLNYVGATVYNADTAPNEYISAIIEDNSGIRHYGRIMQPAEASGEITITIPLSLLTGDYTLYVFSEQYNGDYNTDYASAFAKVDLTVTDHTHRYGADWKTDTQKHWHECPCGEKSEIGNHEFVNGKNGQAICSVCLYNAGYGLSVELNGGSGSTTGGVYVEGSVISIDAGTRQDYRFVGWTSSNGGSFGDASSTSTSFTMPAAKTTITANWQYNADTGKAIQTGINGISGYDSANGYDYIYYGNWEASDQYTTSGPIKWRVLDDRTNTGGAGLFLLSEVLFGTGERGSLKFQDYYHVGEGDEYHKDSKPCFYNNYNCKLANAWQGSYAQMWCYYGFYATCLTAQERSAVLATTKSDGAYTSTGNSSFAASENILRGDRIFFLSAEEAENDAYGFTSDDDRIAYYGSSEEFWWLRTSTDGSRNVGFCSSLGFISFGEFGSVATARPAFNLDMNSVLFTSAAVGGKSASGMDSGLTAMGNSEGNEWKLTILDSNRSSFTISNVTKSDDGTIGISYSNAQTGTNEYISAIIEDNGAFTHYGRILQLDGTQNGSNGIASLTLPSGVTLSESTKLYIFNEQYNGDYKTDYASPLIDLNNIVSIAASGTCGAEGDGSNVKWVLYEDGTLVIYGTGAMADYGVLNLPEWVLSYASSIKKVVVGDGVTRIGIDAFFACSNIETVELHEGLESIGNSAFALCGNLPSIEIPSSVTSIGNGVFNNCQGLESMTVYADTPPALGENVFEDANADLIVYVPYSLVSDYETQWGTNTVEIQGLKATVSSAPVAVTGHIYNGQDKILVIDGAAENGTMVYALEDGVYSENIPNGTNAGDYTVYYKAKGDGITYGDSEAGSIEVSIAKENSVYTVPTGLKATKGQTLADVELPAGWTWKDESLSVGNVGDNVFTAIFTPADPINYKSAEESVTITVAANPSAIAETQEITVYAHNGRIYVDAEEYAIYNLIGQNVTTLNGSLHGLYVVVVEGSVVKIRVN